MESDIKRIADGIEKLIGLLTVKSAGLVSKGKAVEVSPDETETEEEVTPVVKKKKSAPAPVEEEETPAAEEDSEIDVEELKKLTLAALKAGHKEKILKFVAKRGGKSVSTLDPKYHVEAQAFLTKLLED